MRTMLGQMPPVRDWALGLPVYDSRALPTIIKKGELIWITARNLKRGNEHQIRAALNIERCADMK